MPAGSHPRGAAALLFRRATRDDLPAIVAMLADDPLGALREVNASPLPRCARDAFDATGFHEGLGFVASHEGMKLHLPRGAGDPA